MNLKDLQVKVKAAKELAEAQVAEELEKQPDYPKFHVASGRAAAYSHILSDIEALITELETAKEKAKEHEDYWVKVSHWENFRYWSTRAGLYREILGE